MKETRKPRGTFKKYLLFFAGLAMMYLLATFVLKKVNHIKFAQPVQAVIKERNLDPSAFFYTDNLYIDTCGTENPTNHLIPEEDSWVNGQ